MKLAKTLLLLICTGCTAPHAPVGPAVQPYARMPEFDVYVENNQALIVYTGSSPARSAHDFMGGGLAALFSATGCGLDEPSMEFSDKAILGLLACSGDDFNPPSPRGQSARVSPRRGLGVAAPEDQQLENQEPEDHGNDNQPLNSNRNDTNV